MAEPPISLPAASLLQPLAQGQLSRFCGLYCFLNAIQLAVHPRRVSRSELQDLYCYGIQHLARQRQLRGVLGVGMSRVTWRALGSALATRANVKLGVNLITMPVFRGPAYRNTDKAMAAIRYTLERGRPIIAEFSGGLNHYTVVCGISDRRLSFFDSAGLSWVGIHNVSLREGAALHWLPRNGVIAMLDDR